MVELAEGIRSAAREMGVDPVDLATIISYETAGTLNPQKRGPTTKKYGVHRGLIQFGEPQAELYGADFSSKEKALGSQLGPDGAIVKYFKGNGIEPGMGLLDMYSIVNAGKPGRYNARDEAAGGAPGTVREKVENQMGGHRVKAVKLMSDDSPPSESPMPMPRPGNAPTGLLNMAGATPPAGSPAMAVLGGGATSEGTSLDRLGAPKVNTTKARAPARMPTQMPDQASLAKRMMLALSGRQSPLQQARAGMLLRGLTAPKR
jgi:hypothetical protein